MATHVEHEMNACLTEMERLQTKMQELQQAKEEKAAEEKKKIEDTDPNLAVMEEWLNSIKSTKEEYKIELKATQLGKEYNIRNGKFSEYEKNICDKWVSIQNNRNERNAPSQQVNLFQIHGYKKPDRPTQFMINFVEATYNMFQIQQKRIDELEMRD